MIKSKGGIPARLGEKFHAEVERIKTERIKMNTEEFDNLTFRYDTLVLEEIIKNNNYPWKNLWYGYIKTSRKHYCGFEDSELENYFIHYWGKFKREILK